LYEPYTIAEKWEKIMLTIKQKLELIAKFGKGQSATKLATDYGMGL
jgi:hypothetical protein